MEAPPERQVYGQAPPSLLLALAALAALLAVVLFVLGHWIVGVVALAACLLLAVALLSTSRRSSTRLHTAGRNARGRARFVATSLAAWSRAGARTIRLLAEERRLRRRRSAAIRTLGEAVYRDDETTAAWARGQVATLDEHLLEVVRARTEALASASRLVGEEHLATQSTEAHGVDELH